MVLLHWAKLAVTDPELAQVGRFFSHWLSGDLSQIGEQRRLYACELGLKFNNMGTPWRCAKHTDIFCHLR